jgi:uncharacterized membrane protein YdbT with pleckstrin-like domain
MALKDTLLANETVVAETKKHWMAPVRDSWKPALLLVAALIVNRLAPDASSGVITGTAATIMGWVVIGLVVVGLAWIAYNLVVWRTAAFAVTSMRVILEEGLVSRRSSATLLRSITDVQMNVPFIGSRLGYGDLAILAQSGQAGADRFQTISDPDTFRQRIMEAKVAADASVQAPAAPPVAPVVEPPTAPAAPAPDDVDTLTRLAELRDAGAITAEEYEAKKAEILARL